MFASNTYTYQFFIFNFSRCEKVLLYSVVITSGHDGSSFGFEGVNLFVKGEFSMRYIRRIINRIFVAPKFVKDE